MIDYYVCVYMLDSSSVTTNPVQHTFGCYKIYLYYIRMSKHIFQTAEYTKRHS